MAVAVADVTGRLTMMSRGMVQLVGASLDVPPEDFPAAFHLYTADGTRRLEPDEVPISRAVAGELVLDEVISVRRPGQPVRLLRCNAAPLRRRSAMMMGAVVLVTDVTAEQAATTRHDMIRRLLLDTVNHELRTPLTVVLANAELLIDTATDRPDELLRPISSISRASRRLRDTLQHLADIGDLETGEGFTRQRTDVHGLLSSACRRLRHQAQERHISIAIDCPPDLEWNLEPTLVRKAVAALIDNALTHGPDHNEVALTALIRDDVLTLRVTDEGAGVLAEDLERLINPFERGQVNHDGQHRRGLGLALAQAAATSHQGALLFKHHRPRGFSATLLLA